MANQSGPGNRLPSQAQPPPAMPLTQSPPIHNQQAIPNPPAAPANTSIDPLQHKAATFPLASHQHPQTSSMIPPPFNSHSTSNHAPLPQPPAPVNQQNHGMSATSHHKPPSPTSYRAPAAYQAAYQPPPGHVPSQPPPPPEVVAPRLAPPTEKQDESPQKKQERKRDAKDGGRDDAVELGLEIIGGLARAL